MRALCDLIKAAPVSPSSYRSLSVLALASGRRRLVSRTLLSEVQHIVHSRVDRQTDNMTTVEQRAPKQDREEMIGKD